MLRVKAEPSNEFKRHLDLYGIFAISKIYICREPLAKGVEMFVNIFTRGKYNKLKNDLHYDQVFHLYLMILLSNGMWMLLEKNERPVLKPSEISKVNNYEHLSVALQPDTITLREFVENAITLMGDNEFFIYDSITSNCQKFVTDVLSSNNLWSTNYDLFVNQSINKSLEKVNGLKDVFRKITDVGAIFDQITGKGPSKSATSDDNRYFYVMNMNDRTLLENNIDTINNELMSLQNSKSASFRTALNHVVQTLNFIKNLFDRHRRAFHISAEYRDIISSDSHNVLDVELLLKEIRRIIEKMLKVPSPFASELGTVPVLEAFQPPMIFDTTNDLTTRRTGSGPAHSKEPSRSNERKKFKSQRDDYEKTQSIALRIRPELYEKNRNDQKQFLKHHNLEKEQRKSENEQISLRKMMAEKSKREDDDEVRFIKNSLRELSKNKYRIDQNDV